MTKKILTTIMLTALFLGACNNKKQDVIEATPTVEAKKITDISNEVVTGKATDKAGAILEYTFNNAQNTATLKFNNETIELVADTTASGSRFKNDHYVYSEWHGKITLEKDGKTIFEAGKETMPK
ncbi:MliC family protein [Flavobacterium columnare]|uniref:C-type lysozyme inhibitor domain-containing protein n=1 Tax=Flavobacterium columnare TaxID=996 RepID=A0A437U8Y6_9FLAO|nr:MliC family protein [Flavobacterium columnare]RVU90077.1 hypothetical protein EH230_03735 [Flavobacterium columnare]